ncbi:MAG TPA: BBE domain-containing protein [Microlunatus sp.]|nr:BBE domain-containing protein [Microlunatus sp.]
MNYADRTLTRLRDRLLGREPAAADMIKKRYDPYGVFAFPQSVPLP